MAGSICELAATLPGALDPDGIAPACTYFSSEQLFSDG
jgi:hypothetical protein